MLNMIPGLTQPDGTLDPVALRAAMFALVKIDDKIAELERAGKTPSYVIDAARGVRDAIDRWGTETAAERARSVTNA